MTRSPSTRRRRWPRVIGLVAGIALIALVVVGGLAALGARQAMRSLRVAQDGLAAGGADLLAGDLDGALAAFGNADRAATDARDALDGIGLNLVGTLPWFDQDLDAARRVTQAASLAAVGGSGYVEAGRAAGWDGATVPGFAPGGRVDADALREMAPGVATASSLLAEAEAVLAEIDPSELSAPLREPVTEAREEVSIRAGQAATAARLAEILPGMLGADGDRTWLLVTLTPSDPRASGGYPGVYGLLRTDGRRIRLTELAPTSAIPTVPPVEPPNEEASRWASRGALTTFWATTYTPDFPTAAQLMARIWEAGGGEPIDGVIAGDPALMSALLGVVGPVETPVWPETITAENVERIVGAETYMTTSQEESDAWQVGIGSALWDAVLTRPWPIEPMAAAVGEATRARHLQVWTTSVLDQAALEELGVAGSMAFPAADAPAVAMNGFTANRAGFYVSTTTTIEATGDERTATVLIRNDAPSEPRSILLGLYPIDTGQAPRGSFGGTVNFYLPAGARFLRARLDGEPWEPFTDRAFGRQVISVSALVLPMDEASVAVTYRLAS